MARINVRDESITLDEPTLVEGFPGVGLVGKIATDHLVDQFDMRYYASVDCDGLPQIGVYRDGDYTVRPPVRIYASEAHDLLALRSDVPVAARAARSVAVCLTNWLVEHDVLPVYLSGLPSERTGDPGLFAIATGDAGERLTSIDVDPPTEAGVVSGPTGALLNHAAELDVDSIGLVVETDPRFPDPTAARALIEQGIAPIADLEVDVDVLIDRAEEIRAQREQLARRMQQAEDEESTQATPIRMYQ